MITIKKNEYLIYISEKQDGTGRAMKDFTYTNQIQGDNIYILKHKEDTIPPGNDGIITQITNTKIGVLIADCNGIAIMGKQRFGIIHAGRRWLQKGIIQKATKMLHELWEDIFSLQIYIWPSIRQCCYEVGEEFLTYFDAKYFTRKNERLYFDMIARIRDILSELEIPEANIDINTACTSCSGKFFSYRKQNNNQRMVVWIEKKSI